MPGRVALLVAGILVGLALAESGLAIFAPQQARSPRVWHFDMQTGWANRPGARGRLVSPEFDVEFAINGAGLRGPEVDAPKRAGTRRVAIFGDSFAEGWGVAEAETLRAQLEARLQAQGHAPVEVLNFGVAGWGDDQSLLAFRHLGRRFAPDVVVLVVYGNDLWENASENGNGGGGRLVPKPRFVLAPDGSLELLGVPVSRSASWDPPLFPSVAWLSRQGADFAQHSHLATLASRALESTWMPAPSYYERIYARQPDSASRMAWAVTARIIRAFDAEVRASGARFVLLYASDSIEVDSAAWNAIRDATGFDSELDPGHPSRQLAQIASDSGIEFVDLRPSFREQASRGPFFFRERHWNAAGHALAAEASSAVIARSLDQGR